MKIVLTGGSGGGKTTILELIKTNNELSKKIIALEELAHYLFVNLDCVKKLSTYDFQTLILILQFVREYKAEKSNKIILCDRGLLDGTAFISIDRFNSILKEFNLDMDYLLYSYDSIIFLQTIARRNPIEYEKIKPYNKAENVIIQENKIFDIYAKSNKIKLVNYNLSLIFRTNSVLYEIQMNKENIEKNCLNKKYDYNTIEKMYEYLEYLFKKYDFSNNDQNKVLSLKNDIGR